MTIYDKHRETQKVIFILVTIKPFSLLQDQAQCLQKQFLSREPQEVRNLFFPRTSFSSNSPSRSGIGLAIAKHLLDHSHNVTVLARSKDALEKIKAQYPHQVRVVVGDMSNLSLAQKAVDLTVQEFGRMDGIVINHGVLTPVTPVADCNIEAWKHNFDVNFFSAVAFVSVRTTYLPAAYQVGRPRLLSLPFGRVMAVSS